MDVGSTITVTIDTAAQTLRGVACSIVRTYRDGTGALMADLEFNGKLVCNSYALEQHSIEVTHASPRNSAQESGSRGSQFAGANPAGCVLAGRDDSHRGSSRTGNALGDGDQVSPRTTTERRTDSAAGGRGAIPDHVAGSPVGDDLDSPPDAGNAVGRPSHRPDPATQVLVAVDWLNLACRSWHASPQGPLLALLGTIRFVVEHYHNCAIAIVSEGGECFRKAIDPAYKAHRDPMPPELKAFLAQTRLVFSALGWPIIEVATFEADDVLAAIATQWTGGDVAGSVGASASLKHVVICSTDKDLWQLVAAPRVTIWNPYGDERGAVDVTAVEERWGVRPSQLGDLLALMGDSTDGIPGVKGVGQKTAAKLLTECGSLAGVLARSQQLATIKGAKSVDLAISEAATNGAIDRSRKLVELRRDVPLPEIDLSRPARRPAVSWSSLIAVDMGLPAVAARLATWIEEPIKHSALPARVAPLAAMPAAVTTATPEAVPIASSSEAASWPGIAFAFRAIALVPREQWPASVQSVAAMGCDVLAGPNAVGTYLARTPGGKFFSVYTNPLANESQRLTFAIDWQMSVAQLADRLTATKPVVPAISTPVMAAASQSVSAPVSRPAKRGLLFEESAA